VDGEGAAAVLASRVDAVRSKEVRVFILDECRRSDVTKAIAGEHL
jgi:hypothetical protein